MNLERLSQGAFIALAMTACGGAPPVERESAVQAPVRVAVEAMGKEMVAQTIPLTGVLRPRRQATISSKVMANIRTVAVEEGQRVSVGQPLVALDHQDLSAAVAVVRARRDEAEAAIASGRQAISAAESQLVLARVTHERYETLLSKESASQHEYDVAEAGLRAAEAAVEQAHAQTSQAEAGRSQADAQIVAAETMLGNASIAAPIAGVVTRRFVDPGDMANPGMPLLEIEKGGEYRLEAPVPESLIATVRVGQELRVAIEALGASGPQKGRIAQIDRAASDASRTFLVKVAVESSASLRSGLYGQVFLPTGDRPVLSVTATAVEERGQLRSVFTSENGVAHRRLITVGQLAGDHYEVLSGLESGARVILDPSAVSDGSRVEERR